MAHPLRIIAATDFSAAADRAMLRAASLASNLSGDLHLIHVMPPMDLLQKMFAGDHEREADRLRTHAEVALQERVAPLSARFGTTPTCDVVQGRAHAAIMEAGKSLDASLVVVGARGEREGDPGAESVGGTAFKLVARSGLPTLLVRRELILPY
jgi:nucleotide-binding universal stress UspA family protein